MGLPHSVGGRAVAPVLIVELLFGLEDLLSALQTQALAAATAALQHAPPQTSVSAQGTTSIATGQHASGAILSRRTRVRLQAALLATSDGAGQALQALT